MTMTYAPGRPSWTDLVTSDPDASCAFYSELFGWSVETLPPEAGGYRLLRLDGQQVGGVWPMGPENPPAWSVYFATGDADATAAAVTANGGEVLMAPMNVMDVGRSAVFRDPTGAVFSVWQAGRNRGAEAYGVPGAMCWAELLTTDLDRAREFYGAVFGYGVGESQSAMGGSYLLLSVEGRNWAGAMQITPEMGPIPSSWTPYFEVSDPDATAERAVGLGGAEIMRQEVPAGRFCILHDPQDAVFIVIRSNPEFQM
jgi:uncharacterized protein